MSFMLPVLGVGLVLMAREGLTFSGARDLAEQGAR
jgi:hypothetical protein